MTKAQILGIVRHVATAAGGALILSGKADETLIREASGALITLIGVVWSLWEKTARAK